MSMLLFREEAIKARRENTLGAPLCAMPIAWGVITAFFVVFAATALGFVYLAKIARKETAVGILTLSLGEIRVVPFKAGTVTDIYVKEGEDVQAGESLIRISTEQDLYANTLSHTILESVESQRLALAEQLKEVEAAAPREEMALTRHLIGEKNQLEEMRKSLPERQERLALTRNALELGAASLAKGGISGDQQRQRQIDYLAQEQAMAEFRTQIAQLEGSIAQDTASLAKLPNDQAQARAKIAEAMGALTEKQSSVTGTSGYVLKAKVSGRVTALQAKLGQQADMGRPLLTIVPVGSALQAEVFLPSRAIAFIRMGQRVRLLYDAFPSQQFGAAYGTVDEVSSAVLKPDEVGAALTVKEPVYRVIVRPAKNTVRAYGREIPLRSGMALTADIVLEERSFLQLLLDPLIAARGRIMLEDQ